MLTLISKISQCPELKEEEAGMISEGLELAVPDNAKIIKLRKLIETSKVFKT